MNFEYRAVKWPDWAQWGRPTRLCGGQKSILEAAEYMNYMELYRSASTIIIIFCCFFLNLLGENEMHWHDCMCGLTSTTVESLGCFTLWMSQCAHLWATSLFSVLWELGILGFASPLGRYYPPLTNPCSSYLCYPGITSNEQLGTSHSGRLTGLASETLFVQ